jgi:hypothetical protein
MINPAVMVDPNAHTDWTNEHSRSVNADAGANRADVSPDARPVPAVATCMMYADAADDRARFGRNESYRGNRQAQSENYFFHVRTARGGHTPARTGASPT